MSGLAVLSGSFMFGPHTTGEFIAPVGERWLGFVHGPGPGGTDSLHFRCMRSGRNVSAPLDGSWRARRLDWAEAERETGIQSPATAPGARARWDPQQDHLEFSPIARGVYELARDRGLPDPHALALITGGGERGDVAGRGGGAKDGLSRLAAAVLDLVLPPIGGEVCAAALAESRTITPPTPQEALRRVVGIACAHGRARREPASAAVSDEQVWIGSGWQAAAGDLPRFIEAASDRFDARRGGEREGQGALFNALELA